MNWFVRLAPIVVLSCAGTCLGQATFAYVVDGRRCTAFFSGNGSGSTFEVPQTLFAPYQGGADIEADNGVEYWRAVCSQESRLDPTSMTMMGDGYAFVTGSGENTLNAQCNSLFDVRFTCAAVTPYRLAGLISESGHPQSIAEVRLSIAGGAAIHSVVSATDTSTPISFEGVLQPGTYVLVARAQGRAVGFPGQTQSGEAMCMITLSTPVAKPCELDWNGDEMIDSGDFLGFVEDFLNGDADYNGDGETNSADFFEFLERFLNGC